MKPSRITVVLLLLFSVQIFSGCTEKAEEENVKKQHINNELKIGTGWDATRPGNYQPFGMWEPACLIYESLVNLDKDCRPLPCLAEKWEVSPDGLIYTFSLRKGINFHDGTPFNADAVKINFERLGKTNWQALKRVIRQIRIKDEFTVQFVLSRPAPLFFIHLAGSGYGIIAPSAITRKDSTEHLSSKNEKKKEKMPDMTAGNKKMAVRMEKSNASRSAPKEMMMSGTQTYVVSKAIGTGPYKWDEKSYKRATSFSVRRNDDYWQGQPVFERITWLVIPDPSARSIALETGEIQMTGQSPNASLTDENVIALKRNNNIGFAKDNNWGTRLVVINNRRPPFDNIHVRNALRYAIDYQDIQKVFPEMATICPGPFGLDTPFTHPEIKLPEYNPSKAREILDKEGLVDRDGDGFREYQNKNIEIRITTSKSGAMGVLLCECLQKIGIDATLSPKESGSVFEVLKQMDYDIAVHPNIPSFFLDLYNTFHSRGIWSLNPDTPQIDALLDEYLLSTDFEKFRQLSYRVQEEIHKQGIILFAVNEGKLATYHKDLGEFIYPPEEWVGAVQEIWKMR